MSQNRSRSSTLLNLSLIAQLLSGVLTTFAIVFPRQAEAIFSPSRALSPGGALLGASYVETQVSYFYFGTVVIVLLTVVSLAGLKVRIDWERARLLAVGKHPRGRLDWRYLAPVVLCVALGALLVRTVFGAGTNPTELSRQSTWIAFVQSNWIWGVVFGLALAAAAWALARGALWGILMLRRRMTIGRLAKEIQ